MDHPEKEKKPTSNPNSLSSHSPSLESPSCSTPRPATDVQAKVCGQDVECRGFSFFSLMGISFFLSVIAVTLAVTEPIWGEKLYSLLSLPSVTKDDQTTLALKNDLVKLRNNQSAFITQTQLDEIKTEIDALKTVRSAEATTSPQTAPVPAPDTVVSERLETLNKQALERTEVIEHELKRTQAALKDLEAKFAQQSSGPMDRTMLAVILQLILAWQSGQPFDKPWETAMTVVESADPQLAALMRESAPMLLPLRDKGLPTISTLQNSFSYVADSLVSSSVNSGDPWWMQLWHNLLSLISIRRQGDMISASDTSLQGLLARAEVMLKGGDLSNVTALLDGLPDSQITHNAQVWMTEAQARQQADVLSQQLISYVVGKFPATQSAVTPFDTDAGMSQ